LFKQITIDTALFYEELPPPLIAIASEQGIIQIKDSETQERFSRLGKYFRRVKNCSVSGNRAIANNVLGRVLTMAKKPSL
jgi:hypothetical protein